MKRTYKRAAAITNAAPILVSAILLPPVYLFFSQTGLGAALMDLVPVYRDAPSFLARLSAAMLLGVVLPYLAFLLFGGWLRLILPSEAAELRAAQRERWGESWTHAQNSPLPTLILTGALVLGVYIGLSVGICAAFEYLGPATGWAYFAWTVQIALLIVMLALTWPSEAANARA